MSNLNHPAIVAGPLRAADLDRAANPGRIYHLHRATVCPPCHGDCRQGRDCNADACAAEGGAYAEPKPAPMPRRSWLCTAWLRLVRWAT